MTYTRKNIYSLGDDWAPEVLWYARGVGAMSGRALADPTGWRFFGAIHGFNAPLWTSLGWLSSTDQLPSQQLQDTFWKQCQHGSWYFLPWHRGYLLGIEAILRSWIVDNGGPEDWALPYWNYMASGQDALPPAFASNAWPDGGDNPLFRAERYGPNGDGDVFVPQDEVNLDALGDLDFTGPGGGGDPGFAGIQTAFSHSGRQHGRLETQPHDYVHGLVGGQQNNDPNGTVGLMSDPRTAALDPIFYLHHANIDRYWQVWLDLAGGRANPASGPWPDGPPLVPPVSGSPTGFAMPAVDGSVTVFEPGQLATLGQVNYTYDDLTAQGVETAPTAARLDRLGVAAAAAGGTMEAAVAGTRTELLGANDAPLRIAGDSVSTDVRIAPSVASRVSASFSAMGGAEAPTEPDRVFLNLENVRGLNDAARFQVYVAAPGGGEEYRAGSIALFGVTQATSGDAEHAGNGINYTLDITPIVDELHLSGAALDAGQLSVRIVPAVPIAEEHQISIGRVSIYRQGD